MEKEYMLVYGYRRYSACKKLGWKSIPCYLESTGKIIDLPIDQIIVHSNTRLNDSSEGFAELMKSIKDEGLLQPIGVSLEEEITAEDFLTRNLTENIHRSEISPFEISMACKTLKELGLTTSQIAIRLSQPKNRIKSIINLTEAGLHEDLKNSFIVGENKKNKSGTGKIPFAVLKKISTFRGSNEDRKMFLQEAKNRELTVSETQLIINLVSGGGMSLKIALDTYSNYECHMISAVLNKKELKKYNGEKITPLIMKMLKGKIAIDENLIYYKK
jgi:hypothetical protein